MKKHFVKDGKVKLIYNDETKENPKSYKYDRVVIGDTPERPVTNEKERAKLYYDGTNTDDSGLFWNVEKTE